MLFISPQNCKSYIAYLYRVRYKSDAPKELLDSWTQMSQQDIDFHLNALYQKWQLKDYEIKGYESAFNQLQQTKPVSEINSATKLDNVSKSRTFRTQTESVSVVGKPKRTSAITWYVVSGLGIGLLAIVFLNYNKNNPDLVESSLVDATLVDKVNKKDTATAIVRELSTKEKEQSQRIANFVQGENSRNLNVILQSLSPNMEQFKSIAYPSIDEIKQYYEVLWQEYETSGNSQPKVVKLSENVYQLNTLLQLKIDSISRSSNIQIKQKITFNDENYIMKIERM